MQLARHHKLIVEISGLVGTAATVFAWLGIAPAPPTSLATALPTPAAVTASAPATATATPVLKAARVPTLTGLESNRVDDVLKASGLKVGRITRQAAEGIRDGIVVAQQPQAGSSIPYGGSVDIIVAGKEAARKAKQDD